MQAIETWATRIFSPISSLIKKPLKLIFGYVLQLFSNAPQRDPWYMAIQSNKLQLVFAVCHSLTQAVIYLVENRKVSTKPYHFHSIKGLITGLRHLPYHLKCQTAGTYAGSTPRQGTAIDRTQLWIAATANITVIYLLQLASKQIPQGQTAEDHYQSDTQRIAF